jgi:uncharacterized membrane protein YhiD involved in acid resistance
MSLPIDSWLLADIAGIVESLKEAAGNIAEALSGTGQSDVDSIGVPNYVILVRLLMACVIGRLVGLVYRWTFTGKKLGPTLPDTHMLLALGGALIWSVVGNNWVRAFGLAGTIGLIRYRTVVRDPKDTTILLFSMILGMACGLGQYGVAIMGTMVSLFAMAFLHYSHRRELAQASKDTKSLMQLMDGGDEDDDSYD